MGSIRRAEGGGGNASSSRVWKGAATVLQLEDGFGRQFHYLRLSVTEACNFRCTYCLPNGYRKAAPHDFLSVSEVGRLVRAFQLAGVGKFRLTGGEPTARKDLTALIGAVSEAGARKVALTTNGWSLERRVGEWVAAGLTHLNVSVDSFDKGTFARVTGHDLLASILAGVDRALASELLSVKLNAVLLRSTCAAGFDAFAEFIRDRDTSVRFIELMRTGDNAEFFAAEHLTGAAVRNWLAERGWREIARAPDAGPAVEFEHPEYRGRFGLIAPYGAGFCDNCNRLRVTARGQLRLCLFGRGGVDLRDLLQHDEQALELTERVSVALGAKSAGHRLHAGDPGDTRRLAEVGG